SLVDQRDLAIEPGGLSALVGTGGAVYRVVLATGTVSQVGAFGGGCGFTSYLSGLALEADGGTALVTRECPSQVVRLNLTTGGVTTVASGFQPFNGIAIESGGASAVVTQASGRLMRVELATGAITALANDLPALGLPRLDA